MPHLPTVTYSPFDQMVSAVKPGAGTVYFTYGSSGQRVRKVWEETAAIKHERIYLGAYEIFRKRVSGTVNLERQTLHVNDGAQRIAMVETKTIDTSAPGSTGVEMRRFQLGNHLGSTMLEVDETGQIISYEEYHPYGTSAYRASNGSVDVSARRYRYTGKERDEETGLYYNGARYLAAWLGRWTSADPIGIGADGPGIYNYTRGSPVNYTDPSGHQGLPTFRIRPPRIQDTWVGKLFTAAAEGAEEIHEDKQANIERGTAQIEAESSASGGDTSEAVTGLKLFLMRRGNDIIYYPGTFYEMVAGTKASHEKGGVSQVALDVVSAPKKELDQAVDAAHTGDWRSLVEHGLNFTADVVSSVLGARAGAAAGPSLPTRSMALAGGGVLSGVGVGEAVAMTGSTLGGLGAGLLAASTGDPPGGAGGGGSDTPAAAPAEAPPAANPHRVFSGYKQIPGLPSSFKNAVDGVVKVAVNNAEKLESLRSVKPGEWKKVYRDIIGPGGRASVHYFEHSSGTIADPSMRVGWSNKSSKVPK
ncbi:MAG: RHS repeat-associated core domain-containing protein [Myxococcales bacterium]|nr:RHS repeat-associated core domain-containing protein [Myxococcales bacterium]